MDSPTFLIVIIFATGLALFLVAVMVLWSLISSKRREKRDGERLKEAIELGLNAPASLHPIIDPDLCSGCLSCLPVCPEGDLFGVQNGKAVLIDGAKCIGHAVCVDACPTGAISLVHGSAERGVDLPETNQNFESARPGVYVVGELGGMGLIKNALKQGLDVSKIIKESLNRPGGKSKAEKDVAIIGAGPAGIATAVGCRALGLSFRIIDQGKLGGTILQYPKQKVVMMEPVRLPLYGTFGDRIIEKEKLLGAFEEVVGKAGVQIHEDVKAEGIEGADGGFTVLTSAGNFTSRKVVVATGMRGSPRKLGVPGEELPKVTYQLADPDQYIGKRVLVVGGGDSALETAAMLCEAGATTALSYRRPKLKRARKKNLEKIDKLSGGGKLRMLLSSEVRAIGEDVVTLDVEGREADIPNDYVIVCIGGTLPVEFLERCEITLKRHEGDIPLHLEDIEQSNKRRQFVNAILYAIGAAVVVLLTVLGGSYYWTDRVDRAAFLVHENLRPSGFIGHGIGIIAALMMFSNYCYSARKRLGWFKFFSVRTWMSLHVAFGVISPVWAVYHSAFLANNTLAFWTCIAMAVVFVTGLMGRWFFALLPRQSGHVMELKELKAAQNQLTALLSGFGGGSADLRRHTQAMAANVTQVIPAKGTLLNLFVNMPGYAFARRKELKRVEKLFDKRKDFVEFRMLYHRQAKLRMQQIFYQSLRRLMDRWRMLHIASALALTVLIVAHIVISLYFGFGWVFF